MATHHGDEATRCKAGAALLDAVNDAFTIHVGTTVDELLRGQEHGYRPSINTANGEDFEVLADLYDFVACMRGLPLRAYRGA
jgi:hypothetical protein